MRDLGPSAGRVLGLRSRNADGLRDFGPRNPLVLGLGARCGAGVVPAGGDMPGSVVRNRGWVSGTGCFGVYMPLCKTNPGVPPDWEGVVELGCSRVGVQSGRGAARPGCS